MKELVLKVVKPRVVKEDGEVYLVRDATDGAPEKRACITEEYKSWLAGEEDARSRLLAIAKENGLIAIMPPPPPRVETYYHDDDPFYL